MNSSAVLFHEKQKFTQPWLWALLLVILAPFVWGIIKQVILGDSWGDNPMSNIGLLLITLLPLGLIWFFYSVEMETRITDESIQIDFSPIAKTTLNWKDIETAESVTYGFVGYGYRISMKYGTVFNVKGNKGLKIQTKKGRKVVIGTQRPEELAEVARECMANL